MKNTMTPEEASKLLNSRGLPLSVEAVRAGLCQRALPFGVAIEMGKRWVFCVYTKQLLDWIAERVLEAEADCG